MVNNIKKAYETMMISVIALSNEDVLTTSEAGRAIDYFTYGVKELYK
jgi:hypothetical protein